MADYPRQVEPGLHIDERGAYVYAWPPEGRFETLWDRLVASFTEEERSDLLPLIEHERDENSTLVAYTDDQGQWVDVEPKWDEVQRWLT